MDKPGGSWVAIPTPFNADGAVDIGGFRAIVDFHCKHNTDMLFCLGSAGEATMLSLDERKNVVHNMVRICEGRIPVYFGAAMSNTADTVSFARWCESEGAGGLGFTAPYYLLPPQEAVRQHLLTAMQSVSIPVGIYNNPSRTGINIEPDTIEFLARECENFVVDKEAMADVRQLVEVRRRVGDRIRLLCCDFPKYSILIPTLALGGNGAANIGGNVIPEEMALMAREWTSMAIMNECRETYFRFFPLLEALYWFSNPIVIKAALTILGLPVGGLRAPYQDLRGKKFDELRALMDELGVIRKYGVK